MPSETDKKKEPTEARSKPRAFPLWKGFAFSIAAIALFFGATEGVLALFGVQPILRREDPFVGFAESIPLFVRETDSQGRQILVTADNKTLFNHQVFLAEKPPDTYRIFTLGGSTTYGRPYDDATSFSGWLRDLLPAADSRRRWEVINAGGISYASYRVAHLMEELARYQPDLFVVYTGHNEFLEERSYGELRDIPAPIRSAATVMARTRTWTAMKHVLHRFGAIDPTQPSGRTQLSREADPLLRRFGPDIYQRNDPLRDRILHHFRISLERMVQIAGTAGSDLIFVTPASNLKDSSPFKSEHTADTRPPDRSRMKAMLTGANAKMRNSKTLEALRLLDEAIGIDPRFAALHYRRGKALFALGRYRQARTAFVRARDEDVCPLRALSPMRAILSEVARESGAGLVDFVEVLEQRLRIEQGHDIPGKEYFLDHVHPTIEGHGVLAERLVEAMIDRGIVQPAATWNREAIAAVAGKIESRVDAELESKSLSNLAKVLAWAGKTEDASRLARQALAAGGTDPDVIMESANILAVYYAGQGDVEQEKKYFRLALNAAPANPNVHFQIGLQILKNRRRELEIAASHILFASTFWSESHRDMPHQLLGRIMAQRSRFPAAYANLLEAQRLNPQNAETRTLLSMVRSRLGPEADVIAPPQVSIERHPSGMPRSIVQVRRDAAGQYVPDGIWTEWYESGEPERYVDYSNGVPHGVSLQWAADGGLISRSTYRIGVRQQAWQRDAASDDQ